MENLQEILELHKKWLNNNGGRHADLQGAHLQGADLRGADLQGVSGDRDRIHTLQLQRYTVTVLDCEILQIGCKRYTLEEWESFSDAEIEKMDVGALEWWKKHKDFIFMYVDILDILRGALKCAM